ncbi:hypothetical protein GCM10008938_03960 [Deinococcus roseus]|uniref:Uncharacterized protein n=1 Tax=Deinococcus roseus TaxID=392414 RepID=A0ABQ2CY30_9DEIO|nr:hypothetical protein GCM10008938_03960 [Deinococcus roseus]
MPRAKSRGQKTAGASGLRDQDAVPRIAQDGMSRPMETRLNQMQKAESHMILQKANRTTIKKTPINALLR